MKRLPIPLPIEPATSAVGHDRGLYCFSMLAHNSDPIAHELGFSHCCIEDIALGTYFWSIAIGSVIVVFASDTPLRKPAHGVVASVYACDHPARPFSVNGFAIVCHTLARSSRRPCPIGSIYLLSIPRVSCKFPYFCITHGCFMMIFL